MHRKNVFYSWLKFYLTFLLGVVLTAGVFLSLDEGQPTPPPPLPGPTVTKTITPTPSAPPTSKAPTPSKPPATSEPPASKTPQPTPTALKKTTSARPAAPKTTRPPTQASRSTNRATASSPRGYARSALSAGQFSCLNALAIRESGWNVYATNPSSGAYGIPQALPGSKMASAGSDWRTNGVTQVKWMISYVNARYGSPCGAWGFWQSHHWY